MKKQQKCHLEKIDHYNIYECLELFRTLQGLEPALSSSSQYKACRQKVEDRILHLVTV